MYVITKHTCYAVSMVGSLKDVDHGDVCLIMTKQTITMCIHCRILSYAEGTQNAHQPALVLLALRDCISFGKRTGDGDVIVDHNFTSLLHSIIILDIDILVLVKDNDFLSTISIVT